MVTIGSTTHLSNRASGCVHIICVQSDQLQMRILKEWTEVFKHIAISASAIRGCPDNRWNVQVSRVGRILTFRGRVSDGSVVEKLDVVNVVSAANLVVTSEVGSHELLADQIFPIPLGWI